MSGSIELELVEKILNVYGTSRDIARVLQYIHISSAKEEEREKLTAVVELIPHFQKRANIELPLAYIESGVDIETPLLLGVKRIILVDPIFNVEGVRETLKDKFTKDYAGAVHGDYDVVLQINYGCGRVPVHVRLIPMEYKEYFPGSLGAILDFSPPSEILAKCSFYANLSVGGILCSAIQSDVLVASGFRPASAANRSIIGTYGVYTSTRNQNARLQAKEEKKFGNRLAINMRDLSATLKAAGVDIEAAIKSGDLSALEDIAKRHGQGI